jgi:hypothetical protein
MGSIAITPTQLAAKFAAALAHKRARTIAARAEPTKYRDLHIARKSVVVPNRDVSHSTQRPLYVRISVAAVRGAAPG